MLFSFVNNLLNAAYQFGKILHGTWDRGRFLVPLFARYPLHLVTVVFGTPVNRVA